MSVIVRTIVLTKIIQHRIFAAIATCLLLLASCGGKPDPSSSSSSSSLPKNELSSVCPQGEPCRILAVGDSIVQGLEPLDDGSYRLNGGFRLPLFELAKHDGNDITFVGTHKNGPTTVEGVDFPSSHSGFSGITIQDLDKMIPRPLDQFKANIVLIHVGMNDISKSNASFQDTGAFTPQLSSLYRIIADFYKLNPSGLIAVSDVIPMSAYYDQGVAFSRGVNDVVSQFSSSVPGAKVVVVSQFERSISRGPDVLHPNAQGYKQLAESWYGAIKPYLH